MTAVRKKNHIRESLGDRVVNRINIVLLCILLVIILYPLWFTIIASLSNPYAVSRGDVILWPVDVTFEAYRNALKDQYLVSGFINSVINTVCATVLALCVTVPAGYVLSRKGLKGRSIFMTYFMITMHFGGGMIPTYILIKNLGLLDTRWSVVIPAAFSTYNMILVRTFFSTSIGEELYEAATIDGANEFRIFFNIALPLSGAIVAVIALYVAVGRWNSYFNELLYITDKQLLPLQNVLRNFLSGEQNLANMDLSILDTDEIDELLRRQLMAQAMKYSLILIASLPMILVYPFVQKYFVKGVMIGSIKG